MNAERRTEIIFYGERSEEGRKEKKEKRGKMRRDRGRQQKERGAVVFGNKDNIYAFHSCCQLKEAQTWKSIMERFLKV